MAGKGETVKYIIDADTSGFARGMADAAIESSIAGKAIDRNLSKTSKGAENNFKDMRTSAQKTASQIRNFGVALQGFNMTSIIVGVAALSGAIIELSGAIAAAGSTVSILVPALLQGGAAAATLNTGVSGLGAAFKAIQKSDPTAFSKALQNLGPAATQVAYAVGGLNKAFNGIKLNTQNALLTGLGDIMLKLGSQILPTVNVGMQEVGQAMNNAFKNAASLAGTPIFSGLLATIFADTARNINILSGALGPLLTIFTNLYLVTRPYVTLIAQQIVSLLQAGAAYASSARGQSALNLAIQEGLVAIEELGHLVGAVFGLLTAVFRTSVNSGTSLIVTLTGIIRQMEAWVNSAQGQQDLISLFNFTSLALRNLAGSIGIAAQVFFTIINAINSLSPGVQTLFIRFLTLALAVSPISSYFLRLFGAIKLVGVVIVNLAQQLFVVFGALGAVSSVAILLGTGLIILGTIIKGPLGGALIIVGAAIAAYIGLNYLLSFAAANAARSALMQGQANIEAGISSVFAAEANAALIGTLGGVAVAGAAAGEGLSFGARGAMLLQAALVPLLVLAAGVLVILSMLGVFGSKTKQAQGATTGFGSSLGSLQKAMKGVGASGNKASTGGLSALNDSLANVGDTAAATTGSLAGFDKMNVLTDNSAAGAGAGIPGLPSLPNFDGASMGAPTLDTANFDNAIADMQKNFGGLQKKLAVGISNPFDAIGKWIDAHPWVALTGFIIILAAIAVAFIVLDIAALPISLTLGLIVLAVIAIIAIIILLVQNWSAVWGAITAAAQAVWDFLQSVWDGIVAGVKAAAQWVGEAFSTAWEAIKTVWNVVISWFQAIWDGIKLVFSTIASWFSTAFSAAWEAIKFVWNVVIGWFKSVWDGIVGIFTGVGKWFGDRFTEAWNAVTGVFSGLWTWFKTNVWDKITSVFSSVGTTVGNAISGAFKAVVNTVIDVVSGVVNTVIDLINGAIKLINHLPGVNISLVPKVTLPKLAKGGIITSPMVAQLGEAGTEAVMPLENNTGWIDQLASKINAANGSGDGQPINLTVQIGEDKIANKMIDLINEKTQMSGRNTILV